MDYVDTSQRSAIMRTSSRQSVAVLANGFLNWGGGIEFLRIVLRALGEKKGDTTDIKLIVPEENRVRRLVTGARHAVDDILARRWPRLDWRGGVGESALLDSLGHAARRQVEVVYYSGGRHALARVLRRLGASIVLPCYRSLGARFPVPWVGYVYDFQHRYFPQYFRRHEIWLRNHRFAQMLSDAPVVVVNSRAVKQDIERFMPLSSAKIIALPFCPVPMQEWLGPPDPTILSRYDLAGVFFVISNQFWVHKDHETAFEALRYLHREFGRTDVSIVCTGATHDTRFPGHFAFLQRRARQLGVESNIRILGYIPRMDQIQIMRQSHAVIQPTLFEGGPGGGAVYDAVALGIPSIVSDIPVNREIDDATVTFFETGSARDLAQKMYVQLGQVRANIAPSDLVQRAHCRIIQFRDALQLAIESAGEYC